MSIVIVHLSDIHIREESDYILNKCSELAKAIRKYQDINRKCIVVLSGDIAYSGKEEEYFLAENFLNKIKEELSGCFIEDVIFVLAPGNHDCNFTLSTSVRNILIENAVKKDDFIIDDDFVDECVKVQKNFFLFRDRIAKNYIEKDHKLCTSYRVDVGDYVVVFNCLNSSWLSKIKESQGSLYIPEEILDDLECVEAGLNLFVLHHPVSWVRQGNYQDIRAKLRKKADIVFCGHEHYGSVTKIEDISIGGSILVEGACLQENGGDDFSEFHIMDVDLDKNVFSIERFKFEAGVYKGHGLSEKHNIFIKKNPRKENEILIDKNFESWLIDPGANFSHPYKSDIEIRDIFVYPELEESTSVDEDFIEYISAESIYEKLELNNKIIIKGDEKYGKTALLKILFLNLHDMGYAPLYVDASKINKTSSNFLEKYLNECIIKQYGDEFVDSYKSVHRKYKVVLIDGYDKSSVSDRFQWKVIEFFNRYYDRVIITSDDILEINELIIPENAIELSNYRHFKIRPFGNKLRYEMIKKWRSIGTDYNLSSADLIARIDKQEKILNNILGKNLVPRVPIYILTILQSFEGQNQNNDFYNNGLGHYYHYLITQSLGKVDVSVEELDEFFNYLSNLAWFIYNSDLGEANISELEEFNKVYSREYTKIDFSKRLNVLVGARIISNRVGSYSFCYPYIYYFFLGQYISARLNDDIEIQGLVNRCCDHIYIRENSNIVMFVTHHTKDRKIIDAISSNLKVIFGEHAPITFDGDVDFIKKFVKETVSIVYNNSNPDDFRRHQSEIRDEMESLIDEEDDDQKECENELDLLSKVNKMLKMLEILGQMLKSYYGSIKNDVKEELVKELFDAPLRALNDFYCYIEKESDAFVLEIEELIKERDGNLSSDKIRSLAERFSYEIIGIVTTSFILRPATAIASPNLSEVIGKVVSDNNKTSYDFIKLAAELEMPDGIDLKRLKKIYGKAKNDPFCCRIIQSLVLKHLYLFKVGLVDKQRICDAIDIKFQEQTKSDYLNYKAKI